MEVLYETAGYLNITRKQSSIHKSYTSFHSPLKFSSLHTQPTRNSTAASTLRHGHSHPSLTTKPPPPPPHDSPHMNKSKRPLSTYLVTIDLRDVITENHCMFTWQAAPAGNTSRYFKASWTSWVMSTVPSRESRSFEQTCDNKSITRPTIFPQVVSSIWILSKHLKYHTHMGCLFVELWKAVDVCCREMCCHSTTTITTPPDGHSVNKTHRSLLSPSSAQQRFGSFPILRYHLNYFTFLICD